MVGNFIDEFRMSDGSTVDAYLVSSCVEQAVNIFKFIDSTSHSKWDIDFGSHTGYHIRKGFALFETRCNIEEYELIGSSIAISFSQFYRVTSAAKVYEIGSLYRLAVLYIKTRNDSFSQSFVTLNFDH